MRFVAACVLGSFALSGCGGAGSGFQTSVPSVTVPPPPTPAPTPKTPMSQQTAPDPLLPVTSGTLVDAIRANADFRTGSTQVTDDVVAGTLTSRNKAYDSATSIRVYFDATNGRYIVSNIVGTAHRFPEGSGFFSGAGFTSYGQNAYDGVRRLNILTPSRNNEKIALTYTSYGIWQFDSSDRSNIDPQINDYHMFYFGIPTPAADVPRMGTASYRGIAQGVLFDPTSSYNLDGTMGMTVDFGTARVDTRLDLRGVNTSNGLLIIVPRLSGTGSIGAGANKFGGELTASDNSFVGSFQGAFFGPAAQEVGYSFAINNDDRTRIGGGVAVGKQ